MPREPMNQTAINIWYVMAVLVGLALIQSYYQSSKKYTTIPYSQFQALLSQDKVEQVWIERDTIQGVLRTPEKDGLKQFVAWFRDYYGL